MSTSLHPILFWGAFHVLIALLLLGDFLIFQRRGGVVTPKKAWCLTAFWILIALIFNGLVYLILGKQPGLQFFTAYIVEKSLSVDNLFVFLLIFQQFRIPSQNQRKILFWGVLGAIVFRILFILLGIQLLQALHWMTYVFGVFICYSAFKLLWGSQARPDKKRNMLVRAFSFLPMSKEADPTHFFVRENNQLKMTFLFVVLLMIESADIVFAMDSIPAVLAITRDPFIAYTSNVFAILGLRALYFAISPLLDKFRYLSFGLAGILLFIGVKMLLTDIFPISLMISLGVILLILSSAALLSWANRKT